MKPVMLVMIFLLAGHEPVEIRTPAPSLEDCRQFVASVAESFAGVNGSDIRMLCVEPASEEGDRPQRRRGQGAAI